jgi:hypothetical protein
MEQTNIEAVAEFAFGQCSQSLNFEATEQILCRLPGCGGIAVDLVVDVVDANVSRRPKNIAKER